MGDHIRTADGGYGVVENISILHTAQPMYNLTVDTAHTFFVGGVAVLVHNASCTDPIPANEEDVLRAQQIRQQTGLGNTSRRNVGFLNYDIEGGSAGSRFAVSGFYEQDAKIAKLLDRNHRTTEDFVTLLPEQQRRFTTLEIGGYNRIADTESKLLEWAGNPNGLGLTRESRGSLRLYTDRPPCESCSGVISQFREQFPNIELQIVVGPFP